MARDKDSLVEMLAKIPITETRGSLLSSIGKLLRVIDVSESSIMIPTLLKDKYEFDASEMLVLAKILKASILGHNDLVEFYMSESSSQSAARGSPPIQPVQLPLRQHKQPTSLQHYNQNHQALNHHSSHQHHLSNCSQCNNNTQIYSKQLLDSNYTYNQFQNQLLLQSTTPSLRSLSIGSTSSSPGTPLPSQSSDHSLSSSSTSNQMGLVNNGDPDATLRLLMHIEQLKIFIPQVTRLFESIIEQYRDTVETN